MKKMILAAALAISGAAQAQLSEGRWDGTIGVHDLKVPFSIYIETTSSGVKGSFVNGDARIASATGSFSEGVLKLSFDQYATRLEGTLANGAIKGSYGGHAFEAAPYCTCSYEGEAGPNITGIWDVPGEAEGIQIRRKGEDTSAVFLREGAAARVMSGRFDGAAFMLNHFNGSSAAVLEIEPRPDGSLDLTFREPRRPAKKLRAVKRVTSR